MKTRTNQTNNDTHNEEGEFRFSAEELKTVCAEHIRRRLSEMMSVKEIFDTDLVRFAGVIVNGILDEVGENECLAESSATDWEESIEEGNFTMKKTFLIANEDWQFHDEATVSIQVESKDAVHLNVFIDRTKHSTPFVDFYSIQPQNDQRGA